MLKIFPNPSSGTFTIKSNYFENEKIELKIYNSIGALVFSEFKIFTTGTQFNFDLSEHPEGLYLVEVKTKEYSTIKKINLIH